MPKKRKYLPYGLTEAEKADPKLRKKLARCIRKVEKKACPASAKKKGKYDYRKCLANPVAVCRVSISGEKGNPKKTGKTKYKGHNLRWYPKLKPQKGYKVEIYKGKSAMPIASGKTIKEALNRAKKNVNDIFKLNG